MEALLAGQQELYGRIARTIENLKKAGVAKITPALISTTIKLLDAKWERFEEQHERLRCLHWEDMKNHEYYMNDLMGQVEGIYTQQRSVLLDYQESLGATEETKPVALSAPAPPRTTLPRIQLPNFTGKYEDWPAFRDLFTSLIAKEASISDVTKLHYLKVSLKGEAELLVRNLPTTDENFARAWQTLKDYYENTRLLVRSYYASFSALTKMKAESAAELRKLYHCVTSTAGALESIGRPISSSEDLYVFLTVELLDPRSRREWETHIGDTTEPPTFVELRQFLERRLHTLDALQTTKPEAVPGKPGDRTTKSTRTHLAQREKERCSMCRRDHFLMLCETFKGKTGKERKDHVDSMQLCHNCLGKHRVSDCQSRKFCTVCGERHHTTLHDAYRTPSSDSSQTSSAATKTSHVALPAPERQLAVLLATARVGIADRSGDLQAARALVDQGSESSIVSEAFAQRLRLPRTRASTAVYGVGGQQAAIARGQISLKIASRLGDFVTTATAIILPRLTVYAGVASTAVADWPHLRDLQLADPEFFASEEIDVLLGADVYASILGPGVRKGGEGEPVAQETALGWIVSGTVDVVASHTITHLHQCTLGEPLSVLVRSFWEQEEVCQRPMPLTPEEQECEDIYARTHFRNSEGRYVVRLPVRAPLPDLSSTHRAAARMLTQMEGRFARDARLRSLYSEFMEQYEALQHMSRVKDAEVKSAKCYLPHHGVLKEASTTTKLRVVFNGSLTTPEGHSLNNHLMIGQNLLPPLADVLLRWRWHRYVFVADIEKMYRQILVHPADRDLQRILWRDAREKAALEYQLNTVTYGMACAPFLAIRTLRQLADDESSRFPKGASALKQDTYVDDILTGAATLEEACSLRQQLIGVCMAGGFPLKKWAANDARLLAGIPDDDLAQPDPRATASGPFGSGTAMAPGLGQFLFRSAARQTSSRN
ncbi:PREDICTED: uncharacterized protein LOC105461365 [Wasmannia auropunctata]|uniref:uncharacterized protein LOC105461365 n=1 Tax=Wasmannia auropunctata TaxID=64793 RepID=UPI0005ED905A|nr:PREDICTED: uncharacterized protein LOC105461365 [Wasmannia auropunctata]